MRPTKLYMDGFITYQNFEYNFENKPIVIQGENLDEDDQESNGVGKSAILAAMQLLYTNSQYVYLSASTNPKPLPLKELINYDSKKAYIWNETYCPVRKETLKIERRFTKSGQQAQVSVNGVIAFEFEDKMVKQVDAFILEWLAYNADDLINYYLTNKERFSSFFKGTGGNREKLINRFSNADIISELDKTANKKVSELETKLATLNYDLGKLEGSLETLESDLETEKNRDLAAEHADKIASIETEIGNLKADILLAMKGIREAEGSMDVKNAELKDIEGALVKANKDIKAIDLTKVQESIDKINGSVKELEGSKQKEREELRGYNKQVTEIGNDLAAIERNLAGVVTCPNCKFEFNAADPTIDIGGEKVMKESFDDLLVKVNNKISNVNDSIDLIDGRILQLNSNKLKFTEEESNLNKKLRQLRATVNNLQENVTDKKSEIADFEAEITGYRNSIKNYESSIDTKKKLIEEIKASSTENEEIKSLEQRIDSTKGLIAEKQTQIGLQEDLILKAKEWVINYRKFKYYLSNKPLNYIQNQINYALGEMGGDIRVVIDGYKVNTDGSTREEVTPHVYRNGVERNYGSFSGGERGRITFAEIIAFQNILNSENPFGGFNCIMMDEISEGVDASGLSSLIKSLGVYEFPILVTTHVSTNVNENVLLITKQHGISKIKN